MRADSSPGDEAYLVVHQGSGSAESLYAALHERRDKVQVHLRELPPAYVASEETALVAWLNGGDAKPTFTPPRPFERGERRCGHPGSVGTVRSRVIAAQVEPRINPWVDAVRPCAR